jgi:hypothetical protein
MRRFSAFEKKAIRRLVNHDALQEQGLVLMTLYLESNYFGPENQASVMYTKERKVYLSTSTHDMESAREKFVQSITLFNLLRELRDAGLIVFLGEPEPQGALGEQYKQGITFEVNAPFNAFICECLTKYVMVTEELVQLVSDDFVSPEERRHNETKVISFIAIGVSLILGLVSIYITVAN